MKKDFNHTFQHLEAVLCWISNVKDGDEAIDLGGTKGTYKITSDANGKKSRFIVIPNNQRNVEVIVFKDLLESKGFTFKPIGESGRRFVQRRSDLNCLGNCRKRAVLANTPIRTQALVQHCEGIDIKRHCSEVSGAEDFGSGYRSLACQSSVHRPRSVVPT